MRFYKILFSLLLLFLMACHREKVPENLIKKDQFIPLLVDIHLADGFLNSKPQMPDTLSFRGNGLYDAIFKKHQVDSAQFKKSYQYYAVHLPEMNRIYTAVVERLTAKSDSINKQLAEAEMNRNRKKADSLAKIAKADSAKRVSKQDSAKKQKSKP